MMHQIWILYALVCDSRLKHEKSVYVQGLQDGQRDFAKVRFGFLKITDLADEAAGVFDRNS